MQVCVCMCVCMPLKITRALSSVLLIGSDESVLIVLVRLFCHASCAADIDNRRQR